MNPWHSVTRMSAENLVDEWLTLPDVADLLATDVGKVRRLVQERWLVGVRTGSPAVFRVPADFLVAVGSQESAPLTPGGAPEPDEPDAPVPTAEVLGSLRGTVTVLDDARFSDEEIIGWLFTPQAVLGATPIAALRSGHKAPVRRLAQVEL